MRNSLGQFQSRKKIIFNLSIIIFILLTAVGYWLSTIPNDVEENLPEDLFKCDVSPVPCDDLYGIEYKELDNNFWYKAPTAEVKEIERLKNELETRYSDMTIEQKIKYVFGKDGDLMIKVASCESGLNPKAENPNSSATGLFQILSQLHQVKKQWLYNEDVNIAIAKQMFDASGTNPWKSSKKCWSK